MLDAGPLFSLHALTSASESVFLYHWDVGAQVAMENCPKPDLRFLFNRFHRFGKSDTWKIYNSAKCSLGDVIF